MASPARGNDAKDGKPEDPGAIKVFGFDDGQDGTVELDGKRLELVRKYDVALNGKLQWWTGMMGL